MLRWEALLQPHGEMPEENRESPPSHPPLRAQAGSVGRAHAGGTDTGGHGATGLCCCPRPDTASVAFLHDFHLLPRLLPRWAQGSNAAGRVALGAACAPRPRAGVRSLGLGPGRLHFCDAEGRKLGSLGGCVLLKTAHRLALL